MAKTNKQGIIVKAVSGIFKVAVGDKFLRCTARGILKRGDSKLYVGDQVLLDEERGTYYIKDVLPRKNLLIRPYVSNVDCLAIVVAALPAPDWVMVDKLLLSGAVHGIPVAIICNKSDMGPDTYTYAQRVYGQLATIYSVSAETGEGVHEFAASMRGVVCLAGQSAVGKSSLMNALADLGQETGGLSKIQRGRNTTRQIELFRLTPDLCIMDTCGFSLLECEEIDEHELCLYYPDFIALGRCRYNMCSHTAEPECVVKQAVDEGRLDKGRYERYVSIVEELTQRRKNSYD